MSHIETGNTKLSLPVLVDLAAALNVSTDELLGERVCMAREKRYNEIYELFDECSIT